MLTLSRTTLIQVITDISFYLAATVIALLFALNELKGLKPFIRGFFCDDQNLMYPYREDSVSTLMAIVVLMVPTVVIILFTEALLLKNYSQKLKPFLRNSYNMVGCLLLGFTLCMLFIEIVKLYVGRLRPHFLTVCQPNISTSNCSKTFITSYTCQGSDLDAIYDSRKSFPSGHTGAAWNVMTYLAMYIHFRILTNWPRLRVFCPILQLAAICLAAYVSISRLQDYKHHTGDVIGGGIIGIVFTLSAIYQNPKARRGFLRGGYDQADFGDTMDTVICTELHQANSKPRTTPNGQT